MELAKLDCLGMLPYTTYLSKVKLLIQHFDRLSWLNFFISCEIKNIEVYESTVCCRKSLFNPKYCNYFADLVFYRAPGTAVEAHSVKTVIQRMLSNFPRSKQC